LSFQLLSIILIVLLIGLFCLTAVNTAFRSLQRKESKKQLDLAGKLFFYRYLSRLFFHQQEYEDLYFTSIFAQNVTRFCYAILSILFLGQLHLIGVTFNHETQSTSLSLNWPLGVLGLIGLFLLLFIVGDSLGRITGNRYPERSIRFAAPIVSFFMVLLFPLTFIFLKIFHRLPRTVYFDPSHEPTQEAKQELIEIIEESNLNTHLDPHDKKLIEAVMAFKDRIVREVMVPRVDIFSLPHDTTIEDAATLLYQEGYSRIPVYKDTLDNIIGVLMYKDILAKYMEHAHLGDKKILQTPISTLVKNVLYTPETKKISHLLQEFRKQQVHLAIIVDEYGGTEGIVTIEDILEEIVGDIADEYDQEEALFIPLPEGGWLIDARMSILDIEEQLGIEIQQDGDYDTIGGYVFHETGMIPQKGYMIRKPHFELEVIRSNERRVEKLRIKSMSTPLNETSEAKVSS
jgi:CBS domain containing-hemolysin-like protein